MGNAISRALGLCVGAIIISIGADAQAGAADVSPAELIQLGMKAAVFNRADPFSPPFDDRAALGRTFRLVIPLKKDDSLEPVGRNGGWRYEYDSSRLDLTVGSDGWITGAASEKIMGSAFSSIRGFELRHVGKDLGRGVMHNAFGAARTVSYGHLVSVGVASISAAAKATSVSLDPTWSTLSAEIPASPDDARAKVKAAVVVVEGQIAPLENGSASLCDDSGSPATFSSPYLVTERFCVFNAVVQRVAVESGGQTLAEWTMAPDFGAEFWPDNEAELSKLSPPGGHGLAVKAVSRGSPAEKAGLQAMDVIVSFNKTPLYGVSDIREAFKTIHSGASVPVHVWRSSGDAVLNVEF